MQWLLTKIIFVEYIKTHIKDPIISSSDNISDKFNERKIYVIKCTENSCNTTENSPISPI